MKQKVIAPAAINALKEALTNIYWYKKDFRSFLINTIKDTRILGKLNWDDTKRNIVVGLIDFLSRNADIYQDQLINLMSEIIKINDFSHLKKLEDGELKAKTAEEAVNALKKLCANHFDLAEEESQKEERRRIAYENLLKKQNCRDKLEQIKNAYSSIISASNPQERGFTLEKIMRELFTLFDLDPKASFKIEGEQIDGAFTFENTDYLFEAKWQQELVSAKDLDAFNGKLSRKLDNTLGLFLSINGYSEEAVTAFSSGRRLMILMDGIDLMTVLEGRIDLLELLLRKRRHASQTGNIYLKVNEIIIGNQ